MDAAASVSLAPDWSQWRNARLEQVERGLGRWLPEDAPAGLTDAMRYAVLDGGKRLRPLLVLASYEAVLGHAPAEQDMALRAACAVEIIHAYSLVHDDLPCMDNDVLRRGKPTAHVAFGEAQALLAGDALQMLAIEVLLPEAAAQDVDAAMRGVRLCRLLAHAAGASGMAGGQAIDLQHVGRSMSLDALEDMHRRKTGALLRASVLMGAVCAQASPTVLVHLDRAGALLGLAFQIVDDVLDITADAQTLGKTAGKDAAADKPTFVSLLGLQEARARADALLREALDEIEAAQLVAPMPLKALAHWVVQREH